jgi:hypothetical protein
MAAESSNSTRAERRRHRRSQTSAIANYGHVLLPCFVADVSAGGARIKLLEPAQLPKGPAVLETRQLGKVAAELVWQKGLFAGLKFAREQARLSETAQSTAASAQPSSQAAA